MSTEFYFPGRTSQRWLRVGPLVGDLDRFATRLKTQGYARPSAVSKLRLVSNLSRWLQHQGLGVEALDEPRIEAFLLTRGLRCVQRGEATTTRQLLSPLTAPLYVPCPASKFDTPVIVSCAAGFELSSMTGFAWPSCPAQLSMMR